VTILERIFAATEDENRRVILETMPARPGARLLDLGCSNGEWTMQVARRVGATEVHGVELIDERASRARARGIEVLQADLSAPLEYEEESFDVIHSNQVIEHLSDTDAFMEEVRRLLRPDGYALVSTNNLSSWHNVLSLIVGWQPLPCNVSDWANLGNPLSASPDFEHKIRGQTHRRVFTGKALAALARYHGLRPIVERAAGYYPFPPSVARHLARLDRVHGAYLVHTYARGSSPTA
jgi:SAM-dependent methyltransferase